jgi:alpha-ketoglutarate-dependent taurine dioxygenase
MNISASLTPIDSRLGIGCTLTPRHLPAAGALDPAAVDDLLRQHGAVLWRGFDLDVAGFKALTERYSADFDDYRGGGMRMPGFDREAIGGDVTVMTTTGGSQSFGLPLHGELYYNDSHPDLVWFCCLRPAAQAGQTTLAWATALFDAIAPQHQTYFAGRTLAYEHHLSDGAWRTAFQTGEIGEAAAAAARRGLAFDYQPEQDAVRTRYLAPAVQADPVNGRPGFINSALVVHIGEWAFRSGWVRTNIRPDAAANAPLVVRTADGEQLCEAAMDDAFRAAEHVTADVNWQQGDVLLIDNRRLLHGRRECHDPARRIIVRMGQRIHPY